MESLLFLLCFTISQIVGDRDAIILTAVPHFAGFPDTHHIFMIPGTPDDLAQNETLYDLSYSKRSRSFASLRTCKVDYSKKVLYMYDKRYSDIVAISDLDVENGFNSASVIQKVHVGVSRGNVKIALDWISHNLYWTDPMFRWIAMQPADLARRESSLCKIIVKDDIDRPYALAVDSVGRSIYWSDISIYPKIEMASLSGGSRKVIISTGLLYPLAIDVEVTGTYRKIYWVDSYRDTIESANLTGGERRIVKRLSHSSFYDIALFRDVLIVVDSKKGSVHFIDKLTGDMVANSYQRSEEAITGVCMYSEEIQPDIPDYCSTVTCADICVNEGDQASCLCREGFKLVDGTNCTEDTGDFHTAIVLSDGLDINLGDIRILSAAPKMFNYKSIYTSTVGEIRFITVDMVERVVIMSTENDIYSIKIDMEIPQAQHIAYSEEAITGLSLDWRDKNIYWSSGDSTGTINVVSQTSGDVFTLMTDLDHPRGLKLLSLETKMVWISGTAHNKSIVVSNIDGTDRRTVISGGQLTDPRSLEFDPGTNRLYWVDSGHIMTIDLDGTNIDILPVSAHLPELFILYKDYLLWTEGKSLKAADKSHPSNTILSSYNTATVITSLGILDEMLQPPRKGPCDDENGGCEHICIPIGRNRICECEYGFTKHTNGLACFSEPLKEKFLLATDWSHKKVYQVSLESDDDVRALDLEITGNPNAVIYNPFNERVIWADTKNDVIHSSFLNGSDHTILVNNGVYGAFADRLAVDSTSGNVFYTSVNYSTGGFVGVAVISPRHDLLNLVEGVDGGYKPRDIVVDPNEGLMFWSDHGSVPTVKKANMDGTSVVVIVSQNIAWPNGLAIEYKDKLLYVSDGYYNTIQRCTYNGSCSLIHTDPNAHLMDVELSGDYLYYTAWNRPYIMKINKIYTSENSTIAGNAHLGRLDSISIYSSTDLQPENFHCSANEGLEDCSTFCLPTQSGYRCACQNDVKLSSDKKICEDVGTCPSDMLNVNVSGSCTYRHGTQCAYSCSKFYIPATKDNLIACLYGEWNVPVPCVFSDAMCPETVVNVSFGRACTYRNGRNCTYRCPHHHEPTSPDGVMACNNGEWDNPDPCTEKVPHCPTEVDNVRFYRSCTFQNNEACSYFCQNGLVSVNSDYRMTCINGSWETERPCIELTTVMTGTTTTTTVSSTVTSKPSRSTTPGGQTASPEPNTETATLGPRKQESSIVPIAAGVSGGILLIITILISVIICKRRRRKQQTPHFQEFHSPCYQGLEGLDGPLATNGGEAIPLDPQRPDTTYDLIKLDEPGTSETGEGYNNNYASLTNRFPAAVSGEYSTMFEGKTSDYLHPVAVQNDTENFM